jgi:hypothetical protein
MRFEIEWRWADEASDPIGKSSCIVGCDAMPSRDFDPNRPASFEYPPDVK